MARASFYDRLAVVYDWIAESSERRLRQRALRALSVRAGETVLEIGVGTGRALPPLARAAGPAGRVLGIDLSAGMLRVAKRHLASRGVDDAVAVQQADARALPYGPGRMDAVFMSFTLELFDDGDILRVLSEIRRVLKPGGRLCVVSLVEGEPTKRRARLYRWFRRRWPSLIDCHPIALESLLGTSGFRMQWVESSDVSGLPAKVVVGMPR